MSILEGMKHTASRKNAREMIIFSYPKVGKTELCTKLPGNYVILDFEGGTEYFDCNTISFTKKSDGTSLPVEGQLAKWTALCEELNSTQIKFDYIVVDTLTSLYDSLGNAIAVGLYNKEEKKNRPIDFDLSTLTYGVGYTYKRIAIQRVKDFLKQHCECLIMLGHAADKAMGDTAAQMNIKDLAIEGKLKDILALKTDAMGLLYRKDKNTNILSFTQSTGLIGGTRIPHLSNKEFIISTKNEDGSLTTNWKEIFI